MSGYTLLGTSPNLDNAARLISEFFYGSKIKFEIIDNNIWSVSNKNGVLSKYRVRLSKGRYRFEYLG